MGNEIAKGDAKYLEDEENFVEKYQKRTSFSKNDLLNLRRIFAAHALNDTTKKKNYLSLQRFTHCLLDIPKNDYLKKLSLTFKLDNKADQEVIEQYCKLLFLFLSKKVEGKGYTIDDIKNMRERRIYIDDFVMGSHVLFEESNNTALTQFIFNSMLVDNKSYLTKKDLNAYCLRNHSYIICCKDFITKRSLESAKKMIEKLGRQVDATLERRMENNIKERVGKLIEGMKVQYKQLAEDILKHFDQAQDKKIHYPEFFGVLNATPHLLGLLNPIQKPAEMFKMACSGNPSEVTHVYKETHYAIKHSKQLKKNFRRMSVRPGDDIKT
jgi:hypothetical protein